jgi:hypothetical protein
MVAASILLLPGELGGTIAVSRYTLKPWATFGSDVHHRASTLRGGMRDFTSIAEIIGSCYTALQCSSHNCLNSGNTLSIRRRHLPWSETAKMDLTSRGGIVATLATLQRQSRSLENLEDGRYGVVVTMMVLLRLLKRSI